jgi:hypothetical protein
MLSAPEAFMAVANATAAIVEKAPPFVTYRVRGTVHFFKGDGAIDRTVTVRTSDGDALVHDEQSGKDVLAPPFPAPPNFDALSTFELKGRWSALRSRASSGSLVRDTDVHVENVTPLRYASIASRADAVARSVRGYAVTYASDNDAGGVHLHLEPGASYFRDHTRWLRDVWYDPVTLLPTRIVWNGNDHLVLDARYAPVNGAWLLRSIDFERVFYPPLSRIAAAFHGEYDEYRFSDAAPDPRLAPAPAVKE